MANTADTVVEYGVRYTGITGREITEVVHRDARRPRDRDSAVEAVHDIRDWQADYPAIPVDAVLVTRTITTSPWTAEQPGPAEQPVAASTLRPDMVVSHPTWLNGDPVRVVTARVGAGVVAIRYRDVRAHHPDVQVKVPLDFAVTPGVGFEPHTTPTPSRERLS